MSERIEEYRVVVSDKDDKKWLSESEPSVMVARVRDDGTVRMVLYWCPCGCGAPHGHVVNQLECGQGPVWDFSMDAENRPTLSPSIQVIGGCQSHYFIRNGKVEWA